MLASSLNIKGSNDAWANGILVVKTDANKREARLNFMVLVLKFVFLIFYLLVRSLNKSLFSEKPYMRDQFM